VKPILVTGGAGFIGSNLADRLAGQGHNVLIYDALARDGVQRNLDWLKVRHPRRISAVIADVRDADALGRAAADASAVFHLAAQVAVTTSMVEPVEDFDINMRATLTLLEALRRRNDRTPLLFASTNKVYGGLEDLEFDLEGDAYVPGIRGSAPGAWARTDRSTFTRPTAAPRGLRTSTSWTTPAPSACPRP
jgi:CDP-paratose 2-epimerase